MKMEKDAIAQGLEELEETLDRLIECQRNEQEAILSRNPKVMPIIAGEIDQTYLNLERQLKVLEMSVARMARVGDGKKSPYALAQRQCHEKLLLLQELALQNHLLLENSMQFLESVFREVLGVGANNVVYNQLGMMPQGFSESGALVDVKA